jgi:hypothetical protein
MLGGKPIDLPEHAVETLGLRASCLRELVHLHLELSQPTVELCFLFVSHRHRQPSVDADAFASLCAAIAALQ